MEEMITCLLAKMRAGHEEIMAEMKALQKEMKAN
jgi:hypothetical protein